MLIVIGDVDLLSLDDKWCHLVKHCSDKDCLVQGDTFPLQQFVESLQQCSRLEHPRTYMYVCMYVEHFEQYIGLHAHVHVCTNCLHGENE